MTLEDFKGDKPVNDDSIYNHNINYLDQEKLDKASVNDLLVSERNFKIRSRVPSLKDLKQSNAQLLDSSSPPSVTEKS